MTLDPKIAVHAEPVWRDRANFIIGIDLGEEWLPFSREQLWSRQVAEDRFEVCCIPFMAYDLMLGDEVRCGRSGERKYLVEEVTKPSGRYAFRVWFPPDAIEEHRSRVLANLEAIGALFEWRTSNYAAIDLPNLPLAQRAADLLAEGERAGTLHYETARLR
jgi:hypothetical protein